MSIPLVTSSNYLLEDLKEGLTQECKTLLSSLPIDKGWVATNLFQYQGFWLVYWLKAIAFATVNRNRYSSSDHPLLTTNPHDLVPFLERRLFIDNQNPDLTSFTSPRLFSTHLPYVSLPKSVEQLGCKMVYLCRDPRDAFISLWHFTNKLRTQTLGTLSLEEAFERFCRGVSLYGPAWDHIMDYWKKSLERPENVFFLKFEEMKAQPSVQLKRLAEFFGCPFSKEEEKKGVVEEILKLCSFDHLSNLDVNKTGRLASGEENSAFFRRGEVGDWPNHLTPEMIKKFERITEEKFHGSGLQF
ncbi:hypothetical protein NE237_020552 [Protea cynaroides]|uniref:Sulfotransferase n=1 Tax=Protea cynaroides TaxID=273540 RepID=A0A9Q0HAS6_9MAGN|nr:hypothetical protein NE237_020552 [Protea cynaroides]